MNLDKQNKMRKEMADRRDRARFRVKDSITQHQGETTEDFLARGGAVKRLPPAGPPPEKKRTTMIPARG